MRKLFFLALIFVSCAKQDAPVHNIEGTWVYANNTGRIMTNYSAIQFKDGSFYRVGDHGRTLVGKYSVSNDSILVSDNEGHRTDYKIINHTKDTLTILMEEMEMSYYDKNLDYNPDLELKSVHLRTGSCFDTCPEFELELKAGDSIAIFNGGKNSKFAGKKVISITPDESAKIDSLFKWTKIEKYDSSLFYGAVDDWIIDVEITYNDGSQIKVKGTENGLMYRLQPFVQELIRKVRREKLI